MLFVGNVNIKVNLKFIFLIAGITVVEDYGERPRSNVCDAFHGAETV